ncbi:hypothetical protein BaRGS_00037673 [Batillaria attramentaria]|uniref:Uncharacterized protein n=1 Tax=Batillaria attramentaria TaxID=370345 RepID=A0ABD0J851_9CAEN
MATERRGSVQKNIMYVCSADFFAGWSRPKPLPVLSISQRDNNDQASLNNTPPAAIRKSDRSMGSQAPYQLSYHGSLNKQLIGRGDRPSRLREGAAQTGRACALQAAGKRARREACEQFCFS